MANRLCMMIPLLGFIIFAMPLSYAEDSGGILLPSPSGKAKLKVPAHAETSHKTMDNNTSNGENSNIAKRQLTSDKAQIITKTTLRDKPLESAADDKLNTTTKPTDSTLSSETIQPSIQSKPKVYQPSKSQTIVKKPEDFNKAVPEKTNHDLNHQLTTLKREVIGISQAIESLEQALMAPQDNHLTGYLSIEDTPGFILESLSLELNSKVINRHFYNAREVNALQRGAVQRLFNKAIVNGEHELIATIQGTLNKKPYIRKLVTTFQKRNGTKYVQLDIKQQAFTKEPAFQFRTWE